jgi:hypothetical protein
MPATDHGYPFIYNADVDTCSTAVRSIVNLAYDIVYLAYNIVCGPQDREDGMVEPTLLQRKSNPRPGKVGLGISTKTIRP